MYKTSIGHVDVLLHESGVRSILISPEAIRLELDAAVLRPKHPSNGSSRWLELKTVTLVLTEIVASEIDLWRDDKSPLLATPQVLAELREILEPECPTTTLDGTILHRTINGFANDGTWVEWRIRYRKFDLSWLAQQET